MTKYPNGSTPSGGNKRKMGFNPLWIYLLVALSLLGIFFMRSSDTGNKELSWNEFQRIAQEEVFESITVHRDGNKAEAVVKEDRLSRVFTKQELRSMQQPNFSMLSSRTKYVVITHIPSVDKFADYCERVDLKTEVTYVNKGFSLSYFLINWLPMILIIVFLDLYHEAHEWRWQKRSRRWYLQRW